MNGANGQKQQPEMFASEHDQGPQRVTAKSLIRLLESQGKRCALSGVELTPDTVSADHIKPLDAGGTDDLRNVQLVHSVVNSMKGTMSQADFMHWCRTIASHCIGEE